MPSSSNRPRRVVIVGGGYSAASLVVQLVRNTRLPLAISIIEPRENLGRGLAYSATDPDHRLNGPLDTHALDPQRPREVRQWCEEQGLLKQDGECFARSGHIFLRRGDLGAYISDQIARYAHDERSGCTIRHVRDTALSASNTQGTYCVDTAAHGAFTADLLVVATGNPVPALRPPFKPEHSIHPRIIGNPLNPGCLNRIPTDARVLVVGSGLTALDILSTFVRRSHYGRLLAISRRGLRPRAHAREIVEAVVEAPAPDVVTINLTGSVPDFIAQKQATARDWTRALRAEIRRVEQDGRSWHVPFDEIRDVIWQIWPRLPLREKRRFLRRLGIFYDVHRFRTPPMNEEMVRGAEQEGYLRFAAARLAQVETSSTKPTIDVEMVESATGNRSHSEFDYVVNCTGLDHATACRTNPFLNSLLQQGVLRPHATGLGFDVGPNCEALDAAGKAQPALRVIGPPTAGAFGDPLGAAFIAGQIFRILPDVLRSLD